MTLPYDVSRCSGVRVAALCYSCARKTSPGRPNGPQSYISPAVFDAELGIERCRNYVPAEKSPMACGRQTG